MGLILSSHLEKPITDKESSDEYGEKLICGISSMQGWRETQEDAHNCCVNFDEETSLFAVYDGHGGHEVAEYCSENFPEFLKQTELYKEGKFEEAMRDAFLKFDALLTTEDVKAILKQKKLSRENVEEESVDVLKAESDIPIEELITRYQNKLKSTLEESCDSESASSSGAGSSKKSQPSTSEKEKETKIKEEESKDDKTETKMEQGQGDSSSSSSTSGEKTKEEEKELTEKKNDSETDEKKKEEKVELKTESNKETTNIKEEEKATEEKEKDSTKPTDEEKKIKESTEEKPKKALDKTKNCEVNGDISKSDKKMENGEVKSPRKLNKKFVNSLQAQALYHQLIYGSSDDDSNLDEDDEDDETFGENESTENGEKADAVEEDDDDDDDDENVDAEEEDDDDDEEEEDEEDDDDVEEEEEEEEGDEEDDDQEFHFDNVPGSSSGCTANVALLRGNTLYVANAGDSRCVVCRKGEAIEMSFDHKPESTIERTRIEKAGGHVSREGRVNNGLNLSRALGDHTYKQNKDLPAEEQMITALPDIKVLEMTPEDEFMVLACDGIWNSMSNQEVVDFIKERIDMKPEKLSKICEELFDHCLTPDIYNSEDGAGCDNMTALIIQFKSSRNSTKRPASPKDENSSESKRIKSSSDDDKSPVATIAATDDKSSKATTTATQV